MDLAAANPTVVLIAGLMVLAALGAAAVAVTVELRAGAKVRARLSEAPAAGARGKAPASGLAAGVMGGLTRIGGRIAIQDPSQVSVTRQKLIHAGFPSREAVAVYLGVRFAALIAAAVLSLTVAPWFLHGAPPVMSAVTCGGLTLIALLGPEHYLGMRRGKRQQEYRDGFPDMLDLLVAAVEAGLSLDAGVTRVTEELERRYPNLAENMIFLTLELRAGRSRKEAWASFADRLGIDEARVMATMLRQAEEMGTSLGETLRIFSDDMRAKRMLRAEEKAMALPAKLIVPLILFIFPCLLGVLILPAVYRVSQTMHGH
ncbi:type II secretion system F family protein [Phenylobacterium montanum]|uniref:Type II secretion system F family protein n=1 Tax=Phenylobacterium montanum TaxID=2823693 RepID=A0A975ISR4_9CAUL|nr:type II secretion system F family protein [Caulobacter sp. S6]QUD86013.1 type II secretion system F family protein [Caulobacter sp. S6]